MLDEVTSTPPEETTRFFANLRLSFGKEHLFYLKQIGDDGIWEVLAEVLLPPAMHEAWATPESRGGRPRRPRALGPKNHEAVAYALRQAARSAANP